LFQDQNEQKVVALRFLKDGLDRGEYCALVTPDAIADDWQFELQAFGVDVVHAQEAGSLDIVVGSEWRNDGEFNSILMARSTSHRIEAALVNAPGVRILADAAWTLDPVLPADQLCHWEATKSLVLEETEVRVICQYDLSQHSPANIRAVLRTHPVVLLDGLLLHNPFFEAQQILANEPRLNNSDSDAATIEAMLRRLRLTT